MKTYSMPTSQSIDADTGIGHSCSHESTDIEQLIHHFADYARGLPNGEFIQVYLGAWIDEDDEEEGDENEGDDLAPYVNEDRLA